MAQLRQRGSHKSRPQLRAIKIHRLKQRIASRQKARRQSSGLQRDLVWKMVEQLRYENRLSGEPR